MSSQQRKELLEVLVFITQEQEGVGGADVLPDTFGTHVLGKGNAVVLSVHVVSLLDK